MLRRPGSGRAPLPTQPQRRNLIPVIYYDRQGKPLTEMLEWAKLFEDRDYKIVRVTRTLYRERLSTVWLGLDHNYNPNSHVPIIFETMLFAPERPGARERKLAQIRRAGEAFEKANRTLTEPVFPEETDEEKQDREYQERYYPHDQRIQLRYATEAEAIRGHNRLRLQCLIPPRWRRYLLYTLGKDETWS